MGSIRDLKIEFGIMISLFYILPSFSKLYNCLIQLHFFKKKKSIVNLFIFISQNRHRRLVSNRNHGKMEDGGAIWLGPILKFPQQENIESSVMVAGFSWEQKSLHSGGVPSSSLF